MKNRPRPIRGLKGFRNSIKVRGNPRQFSNVNSTLWIPGSKVQDSGFYKLNLQDSGNPTSRTQAGPVDQYIFSKNFLNIILVILFVSRTFFEV